METFAIEELKSHPRALQGSESPGSRGWSKAGIWGKSSSSGRHEESSSCLQGTSAPGQPGKSVTNPAAAAASAAGWLLPGYLHILPTGNVPRRD